VPALVEALDAAAHRIPGPVHCELGPCPQWFKGGRVLYFPVAGLHRAASTVHAASVPIVPDTNLDQPGFKGHLTIARTNTRKLGVAERTALAGISFTAAFDIDAFDLVTSELSPEGPRYATLARIPLPRSR
jgi:2'-5' RNA ligase